MSVRIVAAALKRGDLIFSAPPPARHHTLMHEADRLFGDKHDPFLPDEQGFIDSQGSFQSRADASQIAIAAGQIASTTFGGVDLYSEDLW